MYLYTDCVSICLNAEKKFRNNLRVCFTSQFVSQLFEHLILHECECAHECARLCLIIYMCV